MRFVRTLEVVCSSSIQRAYPDLDPGLATAKEVDNISQILGSLGLLLQYSLDYPVRIMLDAVANTETYWRYVVHGARRVVVVEEKETREERMNEDVELAGRRGWLEANWLSQLSHRGSFPIGERAGSSQLWPHPAVSPHEIILIVYNHRKTVGCTFPASAFTSANILAYPARLILVLRY